MLALEVNPRFQVKVSELGVESGDQCLSLRWNVRAC